MKTPLFTRLVALLLSCSIACYAQQTTNHKTASLDISVEVKTNPAPIFLTIDQTDLIRTQADGFVIGSAKSYRKIGTVNIAWQPNDLYEIRLYTNNIDQYNLKPAWLDQHIDVQTRITAVSFYTGMHLCEPFPADIWNLPFVPFKVWVPLTALPDQTTAPVNSDGSIERKYYTKTLDGDDSSICFFTVPEKWAVDETIGTYGSYKKIIASTMQGTYPYNIELTFAMDLTDNNLISNNSNGFHNRYEANVIIDMVSN